MYLRNALVAFFMLTEFVLSSGLPFSDDFRDGNLTDGLPHSWRVSEYSTSKTFPVYDAAQDGLAFPIDYTELVAGTNDQFRTVSLQTSIRMPVEEHGYVGLFLGSQPPHITYAQLNYLGDLVLRGTIETHVLETQLNPIEEISLRLEATQGGRTQLKVWAAGQSEPDQAQLVFENSSHVLGRFGLFGGGFLVVSEFHAVPEPSTFWSAATAFGALAVFRRPERRP